MDTCVWFEKPLSELCLSALSGLDSRLPIDHGPIRYQGQLSPAGNSGLMGLSEEPGRQKNIILYTEGQRPLSSLFGIGHLDFSFQKSLSWPMGVSGQGEGEEGGCFQKTCNAKLRMYQCTVFLLLCHGCFLFIFKNCSGKLMTNADLAQDV